MMSLYQDVDDESEAMVIGEVAEGKAKEPDFNIQQYYCITTNSCLHLGFSGNNSSLEISSL
jgi:hypothetical protein